MSLPNNIKSRKDFRKRSSFFGRFFKKSREMRLSRLSYIQHHRQKRIKLLFNYVVSLGIVVFLFGALFALIVFAWTTRDLPDPNKLQERSVKQSTTIYDREGKTILYQLHGDVNRKLIKLEELPKYMINATITAEDREFYQHKGFSIRGIIRSFISNIFSDTRIGGSTITQQFVKNAILTTEKTYTRKLKEVILAYRIENKFSKDEILQMYFNEIPYGSVVYGIEAASESYLGKSAKDLSLAQAAVLAAMPQRPTYFSPYGTNIDKLMERQRYILNEMVDLGYITEQEAETAKAEKIEFRPRSEKMLAPHFVMYVRELLAEQFGERYAEEAGLKVTTTLEKNYQEAAEKAIADHIESNRTKYNANNASLIALDTKTGQIMAMVGSADYFNEEIDGQVNVALRPRQPGSSFKPLAYATAFNNGYTADTILFDVETTFKTDTADYAPKNYDLKEHGPVTMKKALAGSLNIPAVKTLYLAGVDRVLDFAESMGYSTLRDRSRFGLSLVLGGGEVKLLEHTAGYATFAREGVYQKPLAILKIEDPDGKILYEYKEDENKGQEVVKPEPIRILNDILSDNSARAYIFGEKNYLTLSNRQVAAKTGTTNDYRDAWTMGYTPSLATGVWVGNNDNSEMKRGADGSVVAAPIWNQFMNSVLSGKPAESFNPPPENTSTKPVLRGALAGLQPVKIDRLTGKLATELTPADQISEKIFTQFHCILYYVNKDDPQGPSPVDPFADPQYASWEDGVQAWVKRQGYSQSQETPPTEYDDLHTSANKPTLVMVSPANGATINSKNLIVNIAASAPRGVKKAEFFLDNKPIGTTTSDPWTLSTQLSNIESGIHTLSVKISDDVGNSETKSLELNFLL
ncbi:MAG: PBP1A family penicillin-binding protein [Patescibacteria group bacterium]|jgi:membrane peptidoglycan carboxypeptidase